MASYFEEIDPVTGQKKKNTVLQTRDPNSQQKVQLSSEALQSDPSKKILQTAQQQAMGQSFEPTELQQKVTQRATELIDKPMGDYDPEKQKQAQLEQYNADWAKSFENMRRTYGGASGSGLVQQEALNNILARNIDRQTLESQLDQQNYENYLNSMTTAIGTGQQVAASNEEIFNQRLSNLGNVYSMDQAERMQKQEQQNTIETLKINQDWQGAQNELDRQMQVALQNNDIAAQKELQLLQQDFEIDYLASQQNWESAENSLSRQLQLAMQSNDIEAQERILDKTYMYEFDKLQQTQQWQQEQNYLNRKLEEAIHGDDMYLALETLQKQLAMDEWKTKYTTEYTVQQNALDRALSVSLAEMDRATQIDSIYLKGQIDQNLLTQEQDWQGIQNSLNRELELAMQRNDIQAQEDITILQGQINSAAQLAQQQFDNAQRIATQAWSTDERLSTQDWEQAMQYYDYKNQEALQNNDIEAQKYLQQMQNNLALTMQTQDFSQEEKMSYLSYELNNAMANNDVSRQQEIIQYQTSSDIRKIREEYGYETALAETQQMYQLALQYNDNVAAEALQQTALQFQAEESARNRVLQEIELQMQQKGLDMTSISQEWDMLKDAVSGYAADTSDLTNYLDTVLESRGISITTPDPVDLYKQSATELNALKYEWGLTHPNYVDYNGNLTESGQTEFNKFYNQAIWGAEYEEETNESLNSQINNIISEKGLWGGLPEIKQTIAGYQTA